MGGGCPLNGDRTGRRCSGKRRGKRRQSRQRRRTVAHTQQKHLHIQHFFFFFFVASFQFRLFFDQADSPEEVHPAPLPRRLTRFTERSSTRRGAARQEDDVCGEKRFFPLTPLHGAPHIYPLAPRLFLVCGRRRQTSNDVWITWFHS